LKIKRQRAEECKQSLDSLITVKEEKKYPNYFKQRPNIRKFAKTLPIS